ncbi:putative membrane protein [Breznakia blatticola]|uniref:Putative membrane protein n=1 Tax=Breznakia blatticola TaxID=1754012 RepID=A0A4R7ZBU7_9FIRM|nr:DMT family transporter [Breznakia blatticola]TDW08053.1 putative membrane protein [Breznakia blatticola]
MNTNKNKWAIIELFLVNAYWGYTTVLMKNVLQYMSSNAYILLRFTSAALFLCIIYYKKIRTINYKTWIRGLLLGVTIALPMLLSVYGLNFTSASNSVFIGQLSFIIVPMFVMIYHRTKPSIYFIITTVLLLLGLIIFSDAINSGFNSGDFITFIGMFINCITILLTSHFMKNEDALELGIAQIIGAAVVSILFGLHDLPKVEWCNESILIIILTGIIGSGVAFTMRTHSQKYLSPILISVMSVVTPIFGLIGASQIPNLQNQVEIITSPKIFGSVMLIIALLYYTTNELKPKKRKMP